jgi:hypothetical protein
MVTKVGCLMSEIRKSVDLVHVDQRVVQDGHLYSHVTIQLNQRPNIVQFFDLVRHMFEGLKRTRHIEHPLSKFGVPNIHNMSFDARNSICILRMRSI